MLFAALLGFVVVAEVFMPAVMRWSPGLRPMRKIDLVVALSRITFPICCSSHDRAGGLLNAVDRFARSGGDADPLEPVPDRGAVVVAWFGWYGGHALAWALSAAGVAQFLWLMMSCARAGVMLRLRLPRLTPRVRETLRIMGPGIFGAGVTQLNLAISTALASLLAGGSVSSRTRPAPGRAGLRARPRPALAIRSC